MKEDRALPEYKVDDYFPENEEGPRRLGVDGAAIVSEYYEKKYGVEIYVVKKRVDLFPMMEAVKEKYKNQEHFKVGFIVPNSRLGTWQGHVTPMIFEKANGEYRCFISDSVARYDYVGWPEDFLEHAIKRYLSHDWVGRQADGNSCATDAMVWLKDGLRLEGEFKSHVMLVDIPYFPDMQNFIDPIDLHKTAQRSQYMDKRLSDINDRNPHLVDSTVLVTTNSGLTLSQKRAKHTMRDEGSGKDRNEFLADKTKKYMDIVEDEYNSYTTGQLKSILRKHQGLELLEGGGGSVASLTKEEQVKRAAMLGHLKEYVELSEVKDGHKDEVYIKLNTERKQRHKLGRV